VQLTGQLQQQVLVCFRTDAQISFRNFFRHVLFWFVNEGGQFRSVGQFYGGANVLYVTVHVVFAGVAVESAGFAEARVVDEVSDDAFGEFSAVNED